MAYLESQRGIIARVLIITAALMFANASLADYFPFRVAFENVPGIEAIESGDIKTGIRVLEQQIEKSVPESQGDVLATLCGAYIMALELDKAASTCDDAVQAHPGETAYNNRGVLRAFMGDFAGASQDFSRARPRKMDEYLEYLRTKDVGLIADGNHGLLQKLSAKHTPADVTSSVALGTATVMDVSN